MQNQHLPDTFPATKEEVKQVLDQLSWKKSKLKPSDEKLAMKCIQRAQVLKDDDLEFSARMTFLEVIRYRRKPDVYISMFPWLLKKCDEDRERYDYDKVILAYRNVLCFARQYASVPKKQLTEIVKDIEFRLRDQQSGERIIHDDLFEFYRETGEMELAEKHLKLFHQASSGKYVKCSRCVSLIENCYLIDQGKYKELLALIDPVLRGEVTCHSNEFTHFHMAMIAFMMLGQWEEARQFEIKSRKLLNIEIAQLYHSSSHLVYYGITGQFSKGREIFEKQFALSKSEPDLPKLEFLSGALEFFKRLQAAGYPTVRLKVVLDKLIQHENEVYVVEDVVNYLDKAVNRIAYALDTRNENDYYKNFIRDLAMRYAKVESKMD